MAAQRSRNLGCLSMPVSLGRAIVIWPSPNPAAGQELIHPSEGCCQQAKRKRHVQCFVLGASIVVAQDSQGWRDIVRAVLSPRKNWPDCQAVCLASPSVLSVQFRGDSPSALNTVLLQSGQSGLGSSVTSPIAQGFAGD